MAMASDGCGDHFLHLGGSMGYQGEGWQSDQFGRLWRSCKWCKFASHGQHVGEGLEERLECFFQRRVGEKLEHLPWKKQGGWFG